MATRSSVFAFRVVDVASDVIVNGVNNREGWTMGQMSSDPKCPVVDLTGTCPSGVNDFCPPTEITIFLYRLKLRDLDLSALSQTVTHPALVLRDYKPLVSRSRTRDFQCQVLKSACTVDLVINTRNNLLCFLLTSYNPNKTQP